MAYFQYNDLIKQITNVCQEALDKEVTQNMKDTLFDIIDRNVYRRYKPIYYKRRNGSNGLKSKRLMTSTNKKTLTIARIYFTTNAKGNPDKGFNQKDGFLKRIEYGNKNPYFGTTADPYNQPRPFMSKLKKRSVNRLIIPPLKKGLRNRGLSVK